MMAASVCLVPLSHLCTLETDLKIMQPKKKKDMLCEVHGRCSLITWEVTTEESMQARGESELHSETLSAG